MKTLPLRIHKVLLFCIVLFGFWTTSVLAGLLTFDTSVSGTITDTNGLGTGFTHRLPGTGYSLASNDPNMSLNTGLGVLTLQSTHSDINGGANLGLLEAPGFFLSDIAGKDIGISAVFRNVNVPNGSDQLNLYFGTSATNAVRAGFHELEVYLINENQGAGDVRPFLSPYDSFTPGDDVQLTFGRTGGMWQLSWQNLTTPTASGSSPLISIPWLDTAPDLYAGVLASNAGTTTPFTATIDSITVVPEPGTALFGLALCGISLILRRRRGSAH